MEIDQAKVEERDDEEMPEPVTPNQSDDETDEDDDPAPHTRARSSETVRSNSGVAHGSKAEAAAAETKGVPPPRALPFTKKAMVTRSKDVKKQPFPPPASDEDDETEDEEL